MPPSTRAVPKPQRTYGKPAGMRAALKTKKLQVYRDFDEASAQAAETVKNDGLKNPQKQSKPISAATSPIWSAILNSSPPLPAGPGLFDAGPAPDSTIKPDDPKARVIQGRHSHAYSPVPTTRSRVRLRAAPHLESSFDDEQRDDHSSENDDSEEEEGSSGILVDLFQDESNIVPEGDDNDNFGLQYSIPSPPPIPPLPSRKLKPMVVIHKKTTTTTTTTTTQRKGILADKTTRSQVVSIGDYDTIVDPRKAQENQILQESNTKAEASASAGVGTKKKAGNKPIAKITRAVKRMAKVVTRSSTQSSTAPIIGGWKEYQPLEDGDGGVKTAQQTNPFLDQFDDEEANVGNEKDHGMMHFDVTDDTGWDTDMTSRRLRRSLRIRKSDVSHMLQHSEEDELTLPKGKYAVQYSGKEEKVLRISVERDTSSGENTEKKSVVDGGIHAPNDPLNELPSEAPVATSTPRNKRNNSSIPEKAAKKLKGPTVKTLKHTKTQTLAKAGAAIRRSQRTKEAQRILATTDTDGNDALAYVGPDEPDTPKEKSKGFSSRSTRGRRIMSDLKAPKKGGADTELPMSSKKIKGRQASEMSMVDTTNDSGLMDIVGSSE